MPFLKDIFNRLPLILLAAALLLSAFAYGTAVGRYEVFPFGFIRDGLKTGRLLLQEAPQLADDGDFVRFADLPPDAVAASRLADTAGGGGRLEAPILWTGGKFQFLELCPEYGCIAVEFSETGAVTHFWPLRPDELERASNAGALDEYPYEFAPTHSFARDVNVDSVQRYANGDLLVIFRNTNTSFPWGAGVARIDPEGHPIWFRRDYSHHRGQLLPDGTALVPGTRISGKAISQADLGTWRTRRFDCDTGKAMLDTINIIDGSGNLIRSIDVVDAVANSPFDAILEMSSGVCNPLHMNYIDIVGDGVARLANIAPGDLILSWRNVNAFAIMDGNDYRVKRVITGPFIGQHSVQHWKGSKFLMFDNFHWNDESRRISRLLEIDLADGSHRAIFPNAATPENLRLFTRPGGNVSISPDRESAIVSFSIPGIAVRVRLSDGRVLGTFNHVHDVSSAEQFPEQRHTQSAIFITLGVDYIKPDANGVN